MMDYGITDKPVPPTDQGYCYEAGQILMVDQVRVEQVSLNYHRVILWAESSQQRSVAVFQMPIEKLRRWVTMIDEVLASPVETWSIYTDPRSIRCQLGLTFARRIRTAITAHLQTS